MNKHHRVSGGFIAAAAVLGMTSIGQAAVLPGFGEVSGTVMGVPKTTVVPVYLWNKEKNVGYGVFAVDGTYRAVNLFPGKYEIEIPHWYAPSKDGLALDPTSIAVTAGGHAKANLQLEVVPPTLNYTGRDTYKDGVLVQTYEEIYPPGKGRDILEHACMVCHGVNFAPSKSLSREGWEAMASLMLKGPAEGGLFKGAGLSAGPPIVSSERLSAADYPILMDYLAANFGPTSKRRAVLQDEWPELDRAALAKAQYIEYRVPGQTSHDVHFDNNGIVYATSGRNILRIDPATAQYRVYRLPEGNSTHGLTVDGDGTVWSAGSGNFVAHLDPETGLVDVYQVTQLGLHGNTPVFNSKGDIWFSSLIGNKIGVWKRATDTITYWESPVANASPYGLDVDYNDKVWYAEYFTGAFVRFDPETETFTRFKAKTWPNSLRRGGPDSNNNIWFGVYGYKGKYGKLARIDAKTEALTERDIPIKYSHPYDAKPDEWDNVWISSMNYLTKFDQKTEKFTVYPLPARTDMPKIEPALGGAIWYAPRWAASNGYGGTASVLYPDKDAITTLRAIPSPKLSNNHIVKYKGPFTKVTGVVKQSKHGAKNRVDYQDKTVGSPVTKGAKAVDPNEVR